VAVGVAVGGRGEGVRVGEATGLGLYIGTAVLGLTVGAVEQAASRLTSSPGIIRFRFFTGIIVTPICASSNRQLVSSSGAGFSNMTHKYFPLNSGVFSGKESYNINSIKWTIIVIISKRKKIYEN
jgi:hypothetical protein